MIRRRTLIVGAAGDRRPVALVTGGGSGIGRELSLLLARDGYQLVVVSLDSGELRDLEKTIAHSSPGSPIECLAADLSLPGAAMAVESFCADRDFNVDLLVNCAGFGMTGDVLDQPLDRLEGMLALNVVTLTSLCHRFGGRMRERGHGAILNVASTIAFQPLAAWGVYAASKAYVSSFTQSLAQELAGSGVTVSCLYPGITRTRFLDAAGLERTPGRWSAASLVHGVAMDPAAVARAALRGIRKGRRRIVPGMVNTIHRLVVPWMPNRLILALAQRFMKRTRR